jgi:hypothetical protein
LELVVVEFPLSFLSVSSLTPSFFLPPSHPFLSLRAGGGRAVPLRRVSRGFRANFSGGGVTVFTL